MTLVPKQYGLQLESEAHGHEAMAVVPHDIIKYRIKKMSSRCGVQIDKLLYRKSSPCAAILFAGNPETVYNLRPKSTIKLL